MATLAELEKRLKGVETAGQLASALKTVSAAKLSQANALFSAFSAYSGVCLELTQTYADEFAGVMPCKNVNAPRCIAVFGTDRGLSGSFNSELFPLLDETADESGEKIFLVSGKTAAEHLQSRGAEIKQIYTLPDVPSFSDTEALRIDIARMYADGEISCVELLYMRQINSITWKPALTRILPFSAGNVPQEETLFLPDKKTVLGDCASLALGALVYAAALETAVSAQSATLIAMRSACDNAAETSARLGKAIHSKRQAQITESVIETSSDKYRGDEDEEE